MTNLHSTPDGVSETDRFASARELYERGDLAGAATREAAACDKDGYALTAAMLRELVAECVSLRTERDALRSQPAGAWFDAARKAEAEAAALRTERDAARQALWDCAEIAGADLDGDATPAALKHPSVEEFAKEAVRDLRSELWDAGREFEAVEREAAALRTERDAAVSELNRVLVTGETVAQADVLAEAAALRSRVAELETELGATKGRRSGGGS